MNLGRRVLFFGTREAAPAIQRNKAGISARTNRIIGKNAPSKYLDTLQRKAEMPEQRMDEVLGTHAIDPATLRADDFDTFFAHRRVALLERIAYAMGKPVAGGIALEPTEDVEDENALREADDAGEPADLEEVGAD